MVVGQVGVNGQLVRKTLSVSKDCAQGKECVQILPQAKVAMTALELVMKMKSVQKPTAKVWEMNYYACFLEF